MGIVTYDVSSDRTGDGNTDAIQTSYARFTSNGFRREKCVSPGSRLIASHKSSPRMVYANKNGLIRVLDPMTSQHHTIIDHHKADTVHDLTYAPNGGFENETISPQNDIWASVATKGVVLWRDKAIVAEIQMPETFEPTKIIWNYLTINSFWILCHTAGVAITFDVMAALPGQTTHPVHQYIISKVPDGLQGLKTIQDGVIDLSWSPFTSDTVATVHANGNLCLWESQGSQHLKQLLQIKTGMTELTRCAVVGPDTILVTSDENRTMALFKGKDLTRSGTLNLVGTKDSFVMETLFPDRSTCRIVMTSRDHGLALVIGLDLDATSPFTAIHPFHSTMAGYSFHCTVVPATEMDMEDPNVRNIKLTLYGPKEIQTWILQEQPSSAIQPLPAMVSNLGGIESDFAEYIIDDEDDGEEEEDETKGPNGAPGLEATVSSNPYVNWLGAFSTQIGYTNEAPRTTKFVTPVAQKVHSPPPQPPSATTVSSPPGVVPPAQSVPVPSTADPFSEVKTPEVVPPSFIDTNTLKESIRVVLKEELIQHTSAISADVARNVLIPAIESITHQILQKVSDLIDQQQSQNRLQLESMSEQLTKVTSLMSVLTKDVQSIQAQQQQQQARNAADEAAVNEQNEAKAKHQVEFLLSQGQIESALEHAIASTKTDLVYFFCEAADLSTLLESTSPPPIPTDTLFALTHRLSLHMTGNTNVAQVDAMLNWIQGICLVLADSPDQTSIAPQDVRSLIDQVVAACVKAQTSNRRTQQMTVQLLRSLIR